MTVVRYLVLYQRLRYETNLVVGEPPTSTLRAQINLYAPPHRRDALYSEGPTHPQKRGVFF